MRREAPRLPASLLSNLTTLFLRVEPNLSVLWAEIWHTLRPVEKNGARKNSDRLHEFSSELFEVKVRGQSFFRGLGGTGAHAWRGEELFYF